ncbi:MAG: hypothetical protein GY832_24200 [Chloroflexi bacterium]|nr:hypothetical protein [Chloroflexota bacterium]
MNCTEYLNLINSYLDDELEEPLRSKVESHLASCPSCSDQVADCQTSLCRLRETFPEQTPPAELWEKVQARLVTGNR